MKTRGLILFLIFAFIFINYHSKAYVTVSGDVGGQTWDIGTYWVSASAIVFSGDTLVIYSGVDVKFANDYYLQIEGILIANGVVFTSEDDDIHGEILPSSDGNPNPGDWRDVSITLATTSCRGFITSCPFRYGGSNYRRIDNIYNVDNESLKLSDETPASKM